MGLKEELQALDTDDLAIAYVHRGIKHGAVMKDKTHLIEMADGFSGEYPALGSMVMRFVEEAFTDDGISPEKAAAALGAAMLAGALIEAAENPGASLQTPGAE